MYTKNIGILLSSLVFVFLSQAAQAGCNAKINNIKNIYDDFGSYQAEQQSDAKKRLNISVSDIKNCQLHLLISTTNLNQLKGQFQAVPYYIKSDTQQKISSSMTRINLVGSSANVDLLIPSGTPVKAGEYSDTLKIKLYDESNKLLDERQFDIQENIQPSTSLSILGYNADSNSVNLGVLVSGKEYNMLPTLKVVTNSDVKLSVSSENKGKLLHEIYKKQYFIDYLLNIDGKNVDLANGYQRKFSYSGRTVFLLKLKLRLEQFNRQAAGEYSDTIRFHVSPLNY
ncbi:MULTISPECIES: hypothetical protein [Marinomonas]|uniref:hypothetical protein n=1 Tax=Marinomonas TaxID=28253 RepID=UPI0010545F2F|nr:hypothetical protein [Marinomonas flavescens]